MPYTLSHPAAVLPLWHLSRKRLRLAALVIGAASPDFAYLLPSLIRGKFSHTLLGIIVVCLPLGWLALWLFDRYGRNGVQTLLPNTWRLPIPATGYSIWNTSGAILLGAISHVIWDSFTHRSGWIVGALPVLTTPILADIIPGLPIYRILQHGSTIVGFCILARPCWCWMSQQAPVPWHTLAKRAIGFGAFLTAAGVLNGLRYLHKGVGQFLVGGGVGVVIALALAILLLGWLQTANAIAVSRSTAN